MYISLWCINRLPNTTEYCTLQSQPDLAGYAAPHSINLQEEQPLWPIPKASLEIQWRGVRVQPFVWLWSPWCWCHGGFGSKMETSPREVSLHGRKCQERRVNTLSLFVFSQNIHSCVFKGVFLFLWFFIIFFFKMFTCSVHFVFGLENLEQNNQLSWKLTQTPVWGPRTRWTIWNMCKSSSHWNLHIEEMLSCLWLPQWIQRKCKIGINDNDLIFNAVRSIFKRNRKAKRFYSWLYCGLIFNEKENVSQDDVS